MATPEREPLQGENSVPSFCCAAVSGTTTSLPVHQRAPSPIDVFATACRHGASDIPSTFFGRGTRVAVHKWLICITMDSHGTDPLIVNNLSLFSGIEQCFASTIDDSTGLLLA